MAKEACPSTSDTLPTITRALGAGDVSGRANVVARRASFKDSLAHDVTSFSSHVPALFHADPDDSLGPDDEDAGAAADASNRFGAMSPISRLASSVSSLWKYDVFLPLTTLYPLTWSDLVKISSPAPPPEDSTAAFSFFFFGLLLTGLIGSAGSVLGAVGSTSINSFSSFIRFSRTEISFLKALLDGSSFSPPWFAASASGSRCSLTSACPNRQYPLT